MPTISCPTCAAKLKLPEQVTTQGFKCPKCGSIIGLESVTTLDVLPAGPSHRLISSRHELASTVPCRFCGESILPEARKCKHCGEMQDAEEREPERRSQRSSRRSDSDERVGFACPFCRSQARPISRSKISTGGWIMFVLLLFFCWPICWVGILMKEDYRVCADCGMNLG
jgi:predicted RNA-binding Zn-ribbon protein involved in translation (DUF1610 family)